MAIANNNEKVGLTASLEEACRLVQESSPKVDCERYRHSGWLVTDGNYWYIVCDDFEAYTALPTFVQSVQIAKEYLRAADNALAEGIERGANELRGQFSQLMKIKR